MARNVVTARQDPRRPTRWTLTLDCGHERIVRRINGEKRWKSVLCGVCQVAALDREAARETNVPKPPLPGPGNLI